MLYQVLWQMYQRFGGTYCLHLRNSSI